MWFVRSPVPMVRSALKPLSTLSSAFAPTLALTPSPLLQNDSADDGFGRTTTVSTGGPKRTLLDASLEYNFIEVIPFNDGSALHEDVIYGGTVVRLMHLGTMGTLYCDESHLTRSVGHPKVNTKWMETQRRPA